MERRGRGAEGRGERVGWGGEEERRERVTGWEGRGGAGWEEGGGPGWGGEYGGWGAPCCGLVRAGSPRPTEDSVPGESSLVQ